MDERLQRLTCPICFESELGPAFWRDAWSCRSCGTRIPQRAYSAWMARAVAASLPGRGGRRERDEDDPR